MKQLSTLRSFEFQWKHLSEAPNLLSDWHWRENVSDYILDELGLTKEELQGKLVLDAGCGNGRWAYGFNRLGCVLFGFDAVETGIASISKSDIAGAFNVCNILDLDGLLKLYPPETFDIIWCWGVLHHTLNPKRGFANLTRFVKPKGVIHLYLYGKKSWKYKFLRWVFRQFSFPRRVVLATWLSYLNKQSVHANFDAFSPQLASEHIEEEVKAWCSDNGFSYKRIYPKRVASNDLFINAIKQ